MNQIPQWTTALRYQSYDEWNPAYLDHLKNEAAKSEWRLHYHVQPITGLLNDPNGFSYFNGKWHLFYQWFPYGPIHGLKSWFHVTSENLVDWQNEGPTLLPNSIYDQHGAYSGSALAVKDKLFIAYTGNVRDENWQRSSFQLGAWLNTNNQLEKEPTSFLLDSPEGYTQEFRDPQVFRFHNTYFLVIGAQTDKKIGKVLTYTSSNLKDWHLLGELSFTNYQLGFMIECPHLVFIEQQPILLFCPQGLDHTLLNYQNIFPNTYVLGKTFDRENNRIIQPSPIQNLDEGFDLYATQAFQAPDGRTLAISWLGLPDIPYPSDSEGWAHCLSLVKELTIENGKLKQQPIVELEQLRETKVHYQGYLQPLQRLATPSQNRYELRIDFTEGSQGELTLCCDSKNEKKFVLSFDTQHGTITLDRGNTGIPFAENYGTTRTFSISPGFLSLQIFVDSSTIEIFVNHGEQVASSRVFPSSNDTHIFLRGESGAFTATLWSLRSIK